MRIRTTGLAFGLAFAFGAIPRIVRAQAVVVGHSVVADVVPTVAVRDSSWTKSPDDTPRFRWSAEIRANTFAEVQVMGPRADDPVTLVRSGPGTWIQLRPGVWNTVTVSEPGRTRVTIEVLGAVVQGPPRLRISAR